MNAHQARAPWQRLAAHQQHGSSAARRRRVSALAAVAALSIVAAACGSRLSGSALQVAEGAGGASGTLAGRSGSLRAGSAATLRATGSPATASSGSGATGAAGGVTGAVGTAAGSGATAGGGGATGAAGGAAAAGGGAGAAVGTTSCTATSANNGGATAPGVTANQILIGNIASISGVAPGLTQSAQQATEAFAAYVNSQGGICGRMLKVQPFDDQNDAGQNAADATQACSSDFALVGSASGFDNGGASAIASCGIPDVAAELSTHQMGQVPNAFGASPGNALYWPIGPANYLKATYPSAVTKAAMIYLNVPATQQQAQAEMQAYSSVGFKYIYTAAVSPTEPNYAPYVAAMQNAGVQYVTEYSDDNSAARLVQAMAQAGWHPQVVDLFSEEYTQAFLSESQGDANGDLLLMATAPYQEASSNPGMQTFLSWMNRVAPGFHHDIFAEFAWSAGLAFLKAAEAVGPHLTRPALLAQLRSIGTWTGNGLQPPMNFGQKIPSQCFSYFKVTGNGYARVHPAAPNSYDCSSGGLYKF